MTQSNIKKIETKIKEAGFNWIPGESAIAKMTKAKQNMHLGLKTKESEMQRISTLLKSLPRTTREIKYADRVDWRVRQGEDWVTEVKDQGGCGSCVAFAAAATIETQARIQEEKHDLSLDLSESDLYFCGGRRCSEGWWPTEALDYVQNNGISEESCFPYSDQDVSCSTCDDRDERFLKIGNSTEIIGIDERKEWLDQNGPLVACMAVYRDFFSYHDGVYRPTSNELAGYHAVSCIGYSEEEQCWICKNSWDKDWGNEGFFKIGYGECDMDTSFAMFGVADITGPLLEQPLEDEETLAWANYTVAEDSLNSGPRVFWAYVDGKWRHKFVSQSELVTLTNIVESSNSMQVSYKGDELSRVFGFKSYEKKQEMRLAKEAV